MLALAGVGVAACGSSTVPVQHAIDGFDRVGHGSRLRFRFQRHGTGLHLSKLGSNTNYPGTMTDNGVSIAASGLSHAFTMTSVGGVTPITVPLPVRAG